VKPRAAWLALLAWAAALVLPAAALVLPAAAAAQVENLSVEPIDISALARMLRQECGSEPADWESLERLHMEYVARHEPLVERACKAIKASEGDLERQRGPSVELQLAQHDLDGTLFAAIAALMPAEAAAGIERVRVRRELAVVERMSGWLDQVTAIDVSLMLEHALRDDPERFGELKPEVDRHRLARRDLVRRLLRSIRETLACFDRQEAQRAAIVQQYGELQERMTDMSRDAEQGSSGASAQPVDPPPADQANENGAPNAADQSGGNDEVALLQRQQQDMLQQYSALHNECWQPTTTVMVKVVELEVALYGSLAPRLLPLQRMVWRRSLAQGLTVPIDRQLGVEQLALALLRVPGVDESLRGKILGSLSRWADADGAAQEAMFRTAGERLAGQYQLRFGSDAEWPVMQEFLVASARREHEANVAREAMQAMVAAQVGADAVGAGMVALEESASQGRNAEFVLGEDPHSPEIQEEPLDAMDPAGMTHRARPTLALLDRFIEACTIPASQAEGMRALLATHESIVSPIVEGDLAGIRGQVQNELMERVRTMPLGDALAAVDEYGLQARATEVRIHDADAAFWRALGELAGEAMPDFASAMRVSTGLAPPDAGLAAVLMPMPGDPIRVALACAVDAEQVRAVLAAGASAEASITACQSELSDVQSSMGVHWLRGSLLWQARDDVSEEERAAFGEASDRLQADLSERYQQAMDRRDALQSSLSSDLKGIVGAKGAWPFRRALAAQAAPNGFRDRHRIMPALDALLAEPGLPGDARADVLGLKDDLEPELRRAEERLIESIDALNWSQFKSEEWVDRSARTHEALWIWWQRDEVERRFAERLRHVVPESLLPDSTLRPIRDVERGRYGM
jgi:hypothetical protein